MKFALYTISFSPHQIPLARSLMEIVGKDQYRYVSVRPVKAERKNMGWGADADVAWHIKEWERREYASRVIADADILMCGERNWDLLMHRSRRGLRSIYCSERWFKPRLGIFKLLNPSYFKMAWRFVKLLRVNDKILYFPMGIHAARDMARLCGLLSGDLKCIFRAPKLDFESKPGGRIFLDAQGGKSAAKAKRYCLDKMRMWGYFVESPKLKDSNQQLVAGKPETRNEKH